MDDIELQQFKDRLLDMRSRLEKDEVRTLQEVDAALKRIEKETYGTCQDCGREISKSRLTALPYTPYCTKCEYQVEQQGG